MRVVRIGRIALLVCALGAACASADGEDAGTADNGPTVSAAAGSDAWARQLRAALEERGPEVAAAALQSGVEAQPLRVVLLAEEEPAPLARRQYLAHLYAARDYAPILVDAEGWSARAGVALDTLLRAHEHALEVDDYAPAPMRAHMESLQRLTAIRASLPPLALEEAELDALVAAADTEAVRESEDPVVASIEQAMQADGPAPAFAEVIADRLRFERTFAGANALADAWLIDALLAYAFEQRHFNPFTLGLDDAAVATDDDKHAAIARRMGETFTALAEASSAERVQAVLDALPPSHPQYAGLLAERARYREIVEAGGWDELRPTTLSRGRSAPRVAELRRRLAAEGYYEGDLESEDFDEALEEAVRAYQETHQMDVTGVSSGIFWQSINTSAERRLQQIELAMQRWRENRIGDDPHYVWVNIPDFHAEVWRDGERQMRFPIVVGNRTRECDRRTGQMRYANATPVQSATMTYVVLNPTWNVPIRIAREELLPELLENPDYFEEQGMERIVRPDGYEHIRQNPGPNNPLGRVKFMFPNPHNTYMHDTNRPQYFRFPIRSFSHGCMRVSQPMELLEYVLRHEGRWDEERIAEIFESNEETTMSLRTPIPVHIEYYVTRVDDAGRANFLSDVYRLDRDRLNPPDPEDLECEPDPEPDHRLVLNEEGELRIEDTEGNQFTREEWDEAREGSGEAAPEPEVEGEDAEVTAGDYGP